MRRIFVKNSVFDIVLLLATVPHGLRAHATENDGNNVIIYGERQEKEDADLPGRGVIFTPKNSSQQDLTALLSSESSVDFVETGRINGSGFSVPRLRGHDTRSTEIWVDDFLIQDPLSGLPLVDDIDLRAFGTVKLFQGLSPLNIHSGHHRGTIQFSPDFTGKKLRRQVGVTYGKPYGTSGYGLFTDPDPVTGPAVRLFAREHITRGDFSYYNDFATPYNESDDRYSIRGNNHRRARMFTPFLKWRGNSGVLKLSGIYAKSISGVPAINPHLASYAEERNEQSLLNAGYTYELKSDAAMIPQLLRLEGHWQRAINKLANQTTDQFGFTGDREIIRQGGGGKAVVHWDFPRGSVEVAAGDQLTRVKLNGSNENSTDAARIVTEGYGGAEIFLVPRLRFFQKIQIKRTNDKIADDWLRQQTVVPEREVSKTAQSQVSALALEHPGESYTSMIYLQYGTGEKLPSLLENFGDGGRIRSNLALVPEQEIHRECGINYKFFGLHQVGLSWFRDSTRNKIVLLPSIAETTRADNLGETDVNGYELTLATRYKLFSAGLAWTRLFATDRTDRSAKKIPGVAEQQGAAQIAIKLEEYRLSWQNRIRGEVYRDRDNTVIVPETRLHDLFFDVKIAAGPYDWIGGISVLNAFNVQKSDIHAADSPDGRGATAISDLAGYPLPGRQIKLTVETAF